MRNRLLQVVGNKGKGDQSVIPFHAETSLQPPLLRLNGRIVHNGLTSSTENLGHSDGYNPTSNGYHTLLSNIANDDTIFEPEETLSQWFPPTNALNLPNAGYNLIGKQADELRGAAEQIPLFYYSALGLNHNGAYGLPSDTFASHDWLGEDLCSNFPFSPDASIGADWCLGQMPPLGSVDQTFCEEETKRFTGQFSNATTSIDTPTTQSTNWFPAPAEPEHLQQSHDAYPAAVITSMPEIASTNNDRSKVALVSKLRYVNAILPPAMYSSY